MTTPDLDIGKATTERVDELAQQLKGESPLVQWLLADRLRERALLPSPKDAFYRPPERSE